MKPPITLSSLATTILGVVFPALAAEPPRLPWEREVPLREAAQSVSLKVTLDPTNPLQHSGGWDHGGGMTINNLKMRTTLWGPPNRITISLNKNNVWDRRVNPRSLEFPTLQEIIEGAYSPANKGYEGKHPETQRPRGYGYLREEGGFLVSAAKNAKGVYFLEIQPRRDNTCHITNPWPNRPVVVHEIGKSEPVEVKIDKNNGECLVFSAIAGRKYSVRGPTTW